MAVVESDRLKVPVIVGIMRPTLIIPADVKHRPAERLVAILHHELAHIRRHDTLSQFLAQLTCCLYWFNPLVWVLERKLFIERERACDDMVLGRSIRPSDYAGHLMDVLQEMGSPSRHLWVTASMAEGTGFKDRILSVLNPTARRRSPRRVYTSLAIAGALLLLAPVAAVSPWAEPGATWTGTRPESLASAQEPAGGRASNERVAMLLKLLAGPVASLRDEAASGLGQAGDPRAVPALIEALNDSEASVREHVATALGKLGDSRALPHLVRLLREDPAPAVREHAASAIGTIGERSWPARGPSRTTRDPAGLIRPPRPTPRSSATRSLRPSGRIGTTGCARTQPGAWALPGSDGPSIC